MRKTAQMPRALWIVAAAAGAMLGATSCQRSAEKPGPPASQGAAPMTIQLTSVAFEPNRPIARKHSGQGEDLSPPLAWSNLPPGAQELALVCDDPDAPRGTWVHWVLAKIAADANGLPEGASSARAGKAPPGMAEGLTSWQKKGYAGPMPPPGKPHRYYFRLYALDAKLDLPEALDKAALLKAMEGHVLAVGELMGTYQR